MVLLLSRWSSSYHTVLTGTEKAAQNDDCETMFQFLEYLLLQKKKIRQQHWNENFKTQVFHLWQGEWEQVINPLAIKFHIHSQHFQATFLTKHMGSILYDYIFIKNTTLHTDRASFSSLKRSKVHPSNKQWRSTGARWDGWLTPRLARFTFLEKEAWYVFCTKLGDPWDRVGQVREIRPPPTGVRTLTRTLYANTK